MTRVKICGLMDAGEVDMAVSAGADAVGFVVEVDGSRHRLSVEEAGRLAGRVPVFASSVAVIAPRTVPEAVGLAEAVDTDILQVHGTLSPEEIAYLKTRVRQRIIAAVPAGTSSALLYGKVADAVLVDTAVAGKLGGTGTVHDWSATAKVAGSIGIPLILAGGLNPGNVSGAISAVKPYAVDASSGLETGGRKDRTLVDAFVKEVRRCRSQ